jgi:pyruvate dehydrogenase E2 component (dihydrolipoamide acetyltransferase)
MPVEILMPALSPTMTDGTLAKWLVKEGDIIKSGKVIAEIETDKATMEVEAVDEGKIAKIIVPAGTQKVQVNSLIAVILSEGESDKDLNDFIKKSEDKSKSKASGAAVANSSMPQSGGASAPVAQQVLVAQETKAPTPPSVKKQSGERVAASPLAKRIADEKGIDLNRVSGSGPNGRVVAEDIEEAMARGGVSGFVRRDESEFSTIQNSTMRRAVAKRLLESKQQIPHFYLTIDCNIDRLLDLRSQLNDKAAKLAGKSNAPAYKLSVNDLIIKASALALKDVPEANASWYDDAIVQYTNVDVSVAVAIEGGLITPVIRNADQKSLPHISNEMKQLAQRAKENKLKPEEYQGGGFSISNLGMYGIKTFSAIINPPQSCILAIGKGEERAVVKNGNVVIANQMTVTLSVDHRAVDGAIGATFLEGFRTYIESPALMLV